MTSNVYKWCVVPQCNNTSIKTPDKLFIYVSPINTVRDKWLNLARRDSARILSNATIYFCEDHFDMPNDMQTYEQYNEIGSISQEHMKPDCIPTKFECQSDVRTETSNITEQSFFVKKNDVFKKYSKQRSIVTKHVVPAVTFSAISDLLKKETINDNNYNNTSEVVRVSRVKLESELINRTIDMNYKLEAEDVGILNNPTCDSDVTSVNITNDMFKIETKEVQFRSGLIKEEQIDLPDSCNETSDVVRGSRTIQESEETNSTMEVNIKLEPDDDVPVNNPTCDSDVTSVNITDNMIKIETEEVQFRSDNNQPSDISISNKDEVKGKHQEECFIDITSDTKQLQDNHVKEIVEEVKNPHKCDVCNRCFKQSGNLKSHMRLHTGEKPFKCDYCNKCFSLKCNLKSHMKTHTGEKPFKCDVCDKCFSLKCTLKSHMKTHTGEKPFKCDVCNKCFSLKCSLKSHMKTHTGEKPFKCDVCDKCFSQSCNLKYHMKTHTGEKPFKCDVCYKCFTVSSSLKCHMKLHTAEKSFKCEVCNVCFKRKDYLKYHMSLHTGAKPFKCDVCNKCFFQRSNLKSHMTTHTGKKPFKCDVCYKCFTLSSSLKCHLRLHTAKKSLKCDVCNECFKRKDYLKSHMSFHTGVKPFKCDVCNKCFSVKCNLKSHMKTHRRETAQM